MWQFVIVSYSGFSWAHSDPGTFSEACAVRKRWVEKRRKQGFQVEWIGDLKGHAHSYEVSDENALFIGDDQGFYTLRRVAA